MDHLLILKKSYIIETTQQTLGSDDTCAWALYVRIFTYDAWHLTQQFRTGTENPNRAQFPL